MAQKALDSKKRHQSTWDNVSELMNGIEDELHLDDEWQFADDDDDSDFISLDRLRRRHKHDKLSIVDVLNDQSVNSKNRDALRCIDRTVQIVLRRWSTAELKTKWAVDLYGLLQTKNLKTTISAEIVSYFHDKPPVICSNIMRIAKEIVCRCPSISCTLFACC